MLVKKNSTYLLQVWSLRSNWILPVRVQAHFQSLSMAVTWTSIFLLNPFFTVLSILSGSFCSPQSFLSPLLAVTGLRSPWDHCQSQLQTWVSWTSSGLSHSPSIFSAPTEIPTHTHPQQKVKNVFKSYQRCPATMTKIYVSLKIHLLKNRVLLLEIIMSKGCSTEQVHTKHAKPSTSVIKPTVKYCTWYSVFSTSVSTGNKQSKTSAQTLDEV